MRPRGARVGDRESGAVAAVTAILAVVLLSTAALSVDLGNAWARKRTVQTQVDVSALSAGHLLPWTAGNQAQIAQEVARYLNAESNDVYGQDGVVAAQLTDGVTENGEVYFEDAGTQIRVLAPSAWVDYGMAGVFGADGVGVQASATVRLLSPLPPMEDVLPFWLPTGCGFGAARADAGPGATEAPAPSGAYVPGGRGQHTTGAVVPGSVAFEGTATVSVTIENLPNRSTGGTVRFTFDADTVVDYPVTWPASSRTNDSVTVSLAVGPDGVTGTAGTWQVWPLVRQGANDHPQSPGTFEVTGGPPVIDNTIACADSLQGNFGQLDSPRTDESRNQWVFAKNIATGLDHQITPFIDAPSNSCGRRDGEVAGAVLDNVSLDGRNCITGSTGNDGPFMMKGLVTGIDGVPGRLNASQGPTPPCTRPAATVQGVQINNDVLSCFVPAPYTLADLTQPGAVVTEDMLDPRVVDSPRFVWVPVVYAGNRAQKDFQPIRSFVPGFITDETETTGATADNGLVTNGNSVESLQVFLFNEFSLPVDERSDTIGYRPELRSIVRLVG